MKFRFFVPLLFFCACFFYFIVSTALLSQDRTPTWGTLTYPDYAILGKEIPISISFTNILTPAQVFISIVYRNSEEKYSGEYHYKDFISELSGTGQKSFILPFFASGTVAKIRVRIGLLEIPLDESISIYRTKALAQPLISSWIPVSRDGFPIEKNIYSLSDLFSKGYQTGYWKDKRGDYSFSGWIITFLYVFCFCVLLVFIFKTSFANTVDRVVWCTICGVILLFAINKQLDLQMLITDIARTAAKEYQFYDVRKPFQIRIISLFASLGFSTFILLLYLLRKSHRSIFLAMGGMICLFSFLVLRLISYHKIEVILNRSIGAFNLFGGIEVFGIFLICCSVVWYYKKQSRS